MEIELIKKFKKELLEVRLMDLRNEELVQELEELREMLIDTFNLVKLKTKPSRF